VTTNKTPPALLARLSPSGLLAIDRHRRATSASPTDMSQEFVVVVVPFLFGEQEPPCCCLLTTDAESSITRSAKAWRLSSATALFSRSFNGPKFPTS
jgi:hypothetical protein